MKPFVVALISVGCVLAVAAIALSFIFGLYLPSLKNNAMFLIPTKTASRSIARTLRSSECANMPRIANYHEITPTTVDVPASEYYIVLRHPYERALSGFAFRKQGGENGDELETDKVAFAQQYDTLEDLVVANPDLEFLPLMEPMYQYTAYFKQIPGNEKPMRPICYPQLNEAWPELAAKFQCKKRDLLKVNTSNSKSSTLGPATKAFIDEHLSGDLAIYEKYCGKASS